MRFVPNLVPYLWIVPSLCVHANSSFLHHRWIVMASLLKMKSCLIWVLLFFKSKSHTRIKTTALTKIYEVLDSNWMSFHGSVALMNHSCSPNVIVTYKGTVAEVRAVQEINPEDEVRQGHVMLVVLQHVLSLFETKYWLKYYTYGNATFCYLHWLARPHMIFIVTFRKPLLFVI